MTVTKRSINNTVVYVRARKETCTNGRQAQGLYAGGQIRRRLGCSALPGCQIRRSSAGGQNREGGGLPKKKFLSNGPGCVHHSPKSANLNTQYRPIDTTRWLCSPKLRHLLYSYRSSSLACSHSTEEDVVTRGYAVLYGIILVVLWFARIYAICAAALGLRSYRIMAHR